VVREFARFNGSRGNSVRRQALSGGMKRRGVVGAEGRRPIGLPPFFAGPRSASSNWPRRAVGAALAITLTKSASKRDVISAEETRAGSRGCHPTDDSPSGRGCFKRRPRTDPRRSGRGSFSDSVRQLISGLDEEERQVAITSLQAIHERRDRRLHELL